MGCVLVLLHDGSDYKGTYISTLSLILGSGHFKLGHRGGKHFLGVVSGLREGRRLSAQDLRHGWAQEWVRWLSVQESSCLEVCSEIWEESGEVARPWYPNMSGPFERDRFSTGGKTWYGSYSSAHQHQKEGWETKAKEDGNAVPREDRLQQPSD